MASLSEILEQYAEKLSKALDLENNEDLKRLEESLELKKRKQFEALNSLVITTCDIAPYGSLVINFGCGDMKFLKSHSVTSGDRVVVTTKSGLESILTSGIPGCVQDVSDKEIRVMFDNTHLFESAANNLFQMTKLPDDQTYKRMKSAVKRIAQFPLETESLTGLLFGSQKLEEIPLPPLLLDSNNDLMFLNESLHPAQKNAIEFALRKKNFGIIHGPPGTGKTTTLVELIFQLVKSGEKVLVCAPSNVAVDNIMGKLQNYKLKVVRLGHPSRVSEENQAFTVNAYFEASLPAQALNDAKTELQELLKTLVLSNSSKKKRASLHTQIRKLRSEIHGRESKMASEVLLGVDVCFSTLGSSYRENILRYFPKDFFSTLVIDEASQSLEAGCWMAIPHAKRTILAGDHHQLSPMILSQEAAQLGLNITLMERAIEKLGSDCFLLLTHQFRMNNKIMDWVSNEMYGGQLTADLSVANHLLADLQGVKDLEETNSPLLLVDTSGCSHREHCHHLSYGNSGEADLVAHMADLVTKAGVSQQSIAIITPYHRQVDLIKESLANLSLQDVEVNTVDGFQGGESEAVILSLVRSNPEGEIGFVSDRRRINVAVSRARRLLCLVADTSTVGKDETIASLIQHIRKHGQTRSAHEMRNDVVATTSATVKVQEDKKSGSKKRKKNKKSEVFDLKEPVTYKNFKEKLGKFIVSNEPNLSIYNLTGFESLKVVAEIERLRLEYEVLGDENEKFIQVRKDVTYESTSKDEGKQTVKEPKVVSKTVESKDLDKKLLDFLASEQITLDFPPNLDAAQRAYVHEQAAKSGLLHASHGGKENRHIVVKKPSIKSTDSSECKKANLTDLIAEDDGFKKALQKFLSSNETEIWYEPRLSNAMLAHIKKETEELGLQHTISDYATYTQLKVLKKCDDLPELEIAETLNNISLGDLTEKQMAVTRRSKKKKAKQSTLPVEELRSDDSDKVLDELLKKSGLCASAKCKTGVRLIGHDCPHCKQRYCIPHTLPEVHGCAAEAKKAAHKEFAHPKPKSLSDDKRKALQKSLKSKLAAKSNLRTAAKK